MAFPTVPGQQYNFGFMERRQIIFSASVSFLLMVAAIIILLFRGLNLGLDFTGGTLVEVGYSAPVELTTVREAMAGSGEFKGAVAQHFGTTHDVLIRLPLQTGSAEGSAEGDKKADEFGVRILERLKATGQDIKIKRVEFVGPQVGGELIEAGGLALLYTFIGMLIYVALRFEFRFALGAVLATLHDPLIILGFFSLTGFEFDLTVLAGVLAVIGYSINDTIVVFDRIRDNFMKLRKMDTVTIMNISINETLTRTTMTSLTTLIAVFAMFFGGELIFGFAMALTVGILIGTYSSIYVASSLVLVLGVSRADMLPVAKENAGDGRP